VSAFPFADLIAPDSLFRNAVLGGLLVTTLCGVLGVYVTLRRIVLLGVALPQVAAAGVGLVFWLTGHGHGGGEDAHGTARIGALAATFAALLFLLRARRHSVTPPEWRVGALLAVSMSATILFVALNPRGDLELTGLLRGDLLAIPDADLAVLIIAWLLTAVLFVLFRRELLLVSFDPEYARTLGFATSRYDGLLYALLGVAIGLGVMTAGPLVVFGFLVLPPLAALGVASSLGAVFALSAGVAGLSSLGGFALAYRADLPAGPTSVAVATAAWILLAGGARALRAIRRHAAVSTLLAAVVALSLPGCATAPDVAAPVGRGTLPALSPERPIAVLRVHDATGQGLRIPASNPLHEVARAMGDPFQGRGETVPDRLQAMAVEALLRREVAVLPAEEVRRVCADAPADASSAAAAARRAGLDGPVLQTTLRRFSRTGSDLLLVQLDLTLVEPADGRVLWSGRARGPYAVPAALTLDELLLDVDDRLFAEAFGGP
jgi:ABC-type Mn2+/Zn2+ transport system permease subunit